MSDWIEITTRVVALCTVLALGCGPSTSGKPDTPDDDPVVDMDPLFKEITQDVGLDFVHEAGPPGVYFTPQVTATGGAFLDFDNDGDLDVYLINGNEADPAGDDVEVSDKVHRNQLFEHLDDGTFRNVTEGSGLGDTGYGIGVAVGDINNDGLPDVYVSNLNQDRLFLNRGGGKFEDITESAGIDNPHHGASVCFVDYDRDGLLDLFVVNYFDFFPDRKCFDKSRRQVFCAPRVFQPVADKLYHNVSDGEDGEVQFEDVSFASGIAKSPGRGLGVAALDFNDDGWPDLYVANDTDPNFIWLNNQDGTFRDVGVLYGAAVDVHSKPQGSMGIAVGDINGDRAYDLVVTHPDAQNNAYYLSEGFDGYKESSTAARLAAPSLPWTGFGTAFADLEHDGDLDLLVVNGKVTISPSITQKHVQLKEQWDESSGLFWKPFREPNQLFINDGKGVFSEFTSKRDPYTSAREISRALCLADIDDDGDLDLLITNVAGPARLYRNDAPKKGHWLVVKAILPELGGRDAYGATITVTAGDRQWRQPLSPGTSYVSSHDPRVHFGLGDVDQIDSVHVRWPDGSEETFAGGEADRHLVLSYGQGGSEPDSNDQGIEP